MHVRYVYDEKLKTRQIDWKEACGLILFIGLVLVLAGIA